MFLNSSDFKNIAMTSKRLFSILATFAVCTVAFLNSCSNDVLPLPTEPECADTLTYTQHLEPIVAASCAFAGCHDGSGSAPGDFRTYSGMLSRLESDLIKTRVITLKTMPIFPGSLTAEELDQFKCWLEQGHLE